MLKKSTGMVEVKNNVLCQNLFHLLNFWQEQIRRLEFYDETLLRVDPETNTIKKVCDKKNISTVILTSPISFTLIIQTLIFLFLFFLVLININCITVKILLKRSVNITRYYPQKKR